MVRPDYDWHPVVNRPRQVVRGCRKEPAQVSTLSVGPGRTSQIPMNPNGPPSFRWEQTSISLLLSVFHLSPTTTHRLYRSESPNISFWATVSNFALTGFGPLSLSTQWGTKPDWNRPSPRRPSGFDPTTGTSWDGATLNRG